MKIHKVPLWLSRVDNMCAFEALLKPVYKYHLDHIHDYAYECKSAMVPNNYPNHF